MFIIIHIYIYISSLSIFSYHIPSDSLNQTKQANELRIPSLQNEIHFAEPAIFNCLNQSALEILIKYLN